MDWAFLVAWLLFLGAILRLWYRDSQRMERRMRRYDEYMERMDEQEER